LEHLKSALQIVTHFLEENDYHYAVIGGIALSYWGVTRYTQDIDIKILAPDINYTSVREALRAAFPQPARTHIPQNPLIVAVMVDEVIVDFLLALPGYEELIIQRAIQRDLDDLSVWICSAEDLIIQKAIAGRGKDWLDIEALMIEQRGHLDEAYIESWLSQFAEALEMPTILSDYRSLQEKVQGI
jgi:predicted nucleotidyltransferase